MNKLTRTLNACSGRRIEIHDAITSSPSRSHEGERAGGDSCWTRVSATMCRERLVILGSRLLCRFNEFSFVLWKFAIEDGLDGSVRKMICSFSGL